MTIRNTNILIDNVTAPGTKGSYLFDFKYDENDSRIFACELASGDSLDLYYITDVAETIKHLAKTYTGTATNTTFADVITGPWFKIEVEKRGENGAAKAVIVG